MEGKYTMFYKILHRVEYAQNYYIIYNPSKLLPAYLVLNFICKQKTVITSYSFCGVAKRGLKAWGIQTSWLELSPQTKNIRTFYFTFDRRTPM
jgi:hypothetical protein